MTVVPNHAAAMTNAAPAGRWWRTPVLAPMLARRNASAGFALIAAVQIWAGLTHVHTIACPVLFATGVPCPGCGASRACAALVRGDFATAFRLHAFAPVFLLIAVLFAVNALLPGARRQHISRIVEVIERKTGISTLILAALLVYWAFRLLHAPHDFIRLMKV